MTIYPHAHRRDRKQIKVAADAFVERLGMRRKATWDDLRCAVERVYAKPIHFVATANTGLQAVTGLWIDTPTFGAAVCRVGDEREYQGQAICHELAHILFIHAPAGWFSTTLPGPHMTDASSGRASQLCSKDDDSENPREIAVEEVAFALARRIQVLRRSDDEVYFG